MFKGREVEILPEDYLNEGYCLTRDLEFGIELTMRRDELDPWVKEVRPKVEPQKKKDVSRKEKAHKRKEVKKVARSAPCFEYEVAVMDSPNLTGEAKLLYGALRRLKKNGKSGITLDKAVQISGVKKVVAKKAEKQLISLGVVTVNDGHFSFTLQEEGTEQAKALEKLKEGPK